MILQALVGYYDRLLAAGKLERPGWQQVKVSYALRINEQGALLGIVPTFSEQERGKKKVPVPQIMNLPSQVKRSSGVSANFLCDNAAYFLGLDSKGKPERARACFTASSERHHEILDRVDSPAARAVLAFFDTWDTGSAPENEHVRPLLKELGAANLVFMIGLNYAQEDEGIRAAWQAEYDAVPKEAQIRSCLVTGERGPVARLHPSVKGIQGAQTMGATIVSFNSPAFESYGHDGEQGGNAPVGERAAFAYGAALNYLTANRNHNVRIGDTTVLFWSEDAEDSYVDLMQAFMGSDSMSNDELKQMMHNLSRGVRVEWNGRELDPATRFYILGLAPNAARLSVRFFYCDSFGNLAENVQKHYDDMEIIRPGFENNGFIPPWQMLRETVNQKATDKTPSPQMAGDMLRAILTGGMYPATFYNQLQMRIRAESDVPWRKAAGIKTFLKRNIVGSQKQKEYEEVLTVQLNETTTNEPYVLGRLFAVLERLQEAANPGINTTIRDRYFVSACGTPALVFPTLINLAQAHLKKLDGGLAVYYDKQITQLMGMMQGFYPKQLDIYDQGVFQLGYYQQKQKFFEKKEDQAK